MAIQAGAYNLELTQGGDGILLGGVPGVEPARVLVIGAVYYWSSRREVTEILEEAEREQMAQS